MNWTKTKGAMFWIAGCLVVFFLVIIISSGEKESEKKEKELTLSRPLSGTFEVPAGAGIYTAEVFLPQGEWMLVKPEAEIDFWNEVTEEKIKIPPGGERLYGRGAGKLKFIKKTVLVKVFWKIL